MIHFLNFLISITAGIILGHFIGLGALNYAEETGHNTFFVFFVVIIVTVIAFHPNIIPGG